MPEANSGILRILIVHPDDATRASIAETLRSITSESLTLQEAGSLTEGLRIATWFDPRFVLMDLGEERHLALEVAREIRRPDRRIIGLFNPLVLRETEMDYLRRAARAGVGDFVPLPASETELAEALAAGPRSVGEKKVRAEGRTIAFISHKGGVGATTLAINSAMILAGSGVMGSAVLCDASLQFGNAAGYLGLAPDKDMAHLVRELDDPGALPTYLAQDERTGLQVLASPRDPVAAEHIGPEDLSRVLLQLRRRFDTVVVDAPSVLDLMTLSVLDLSELVFVVTEAVAPIVVETRRFLRLLEEQGLAAERVRLVLNRYEDFEGNLAVNTVSEQLGRRVDHVVPYDRTVVVGANRGVASVLNREKSDFSEAVRGIVEDAVQSLRSLSNRPTGET